MSNCSVHLTSQLLFVRIIRRLRIQDKDKTRQDKTKHLIWLARLLILRIGRPGLVSQSTMVVRKAARQAVDSLRPTIEEYGDILGQKLDNATLGFAVFTLISVATPLLLLFQGRGKSSRLCCQRNPVPLCSQRAQDLTKAKPLQLQPCKERCHT